MENVEKKSKSFILVKNCGGSWSTRDQELLSKQMKYGWDIGSHTPNRTAIQEGDLALIYVSGSGAKVLVGELVLGSDVTSLPENLRRKYFALPLVMSADYWVKVANFKFWKKPLPIRDVVGQISVIKNKKNFGAYLMGGVAQIKNEDYSKVISFANSRKLR
jgi:predicted RNA-binding protein